MVLLTMESKSIKRYDKRCFSSPFIQLAAGNAVVRACQSMHASSFLLFSIGVCKPSLSGAHCGVHLVITLARAIVWECYLDHH